MKLKTVKTSSLKPHKSNPNRHPQEQLQELQSSLDQFDQVKNIVVWRGQVIAGCGLLEAAKKQNRAEIEVQDVSDWPEEKAIKFMIADNRLAEIAIMDDEALANLLREFDEPLDVPGIDESFLETIFESETPDKISIDDNADTDEAKIIVRIEIEQVLWASKRAEVKNDINEVWLKYKKYMKYQIKE